MLVYFFCVKDAMVWRRYNFVKLCEINFGLLLVMKGYRSYYTNGCLMASKVSYALNNYRLTVLSSLFQKGYQWHRQLAASASTCSGVPFVTAWLPVNGHWIVTWRLTLLINPTSATFARRPSSIRTRGQTIRRCTAWMSPCRKAFQFHPKCFWIILLLFVYFLLLFFCVCGKRSYSLRFVQVLFIWPFPNFV